MRRAIFIIITLLCIGVKVHAQIDPTLAGMVLIYTEKSKKTLKNQEKIMLLQTTGHIWTKEEVEAVTDLQREFNDYLDSFRSVISYAAQIYGFYHEITHLTENMGEFTGQLRKSPANATYSNGLVVTICAFAVTDKMMPNRSIVILVIGDLIDSFSLFVKLYTLSDNIHDIDSFGQTCQFQLGRGPVHRQHRDSL